MRNLAEVMTVLLEMLTPGEVYTELVERGLIPPCPTTVTESTVEAIYQRALGNVPASEDAYTIAANFKSPKGDSVQRQRWLREVLDTL